MLKRLTTLSTETVHENPWWSYKHDTYTLPNGETGDYYYGEQYGSVIVVGITDDKKILLVRQYRYLSEQVTVEFPMGAADEGEKSETTAAREFFEETGYNAKEFINVSAFAPQQGRFKDTFHVFIARGLGEQKQQHLEEAEQIEIIYRRPDEIDDMIVRGECNDGPTLATWALVRHRLLQLI